VPSWAPDLEIIGQRSLNQLYMPPTEAIRRALEASRGIAPIVKFRSDHHVLFTLGYNMGKAVEKQANGGSKTDRNYHGTSPLGESERLSATLVGLFGINAPFLLKERSEPNTY